MKTSVRRFMRLPSCYLLDGIFSAEKLAYIGADSPRERIECKFHAARISHIEVQVGFRVETQSGGKTVIPVDGRAACGQVIGVKDAPVLATGARSARGSGPAEDRLVAPWSDVVGGQRQREGV